MTTTRLEHSPQRDQAWGQHYAKRGLDAVTKRHFVPLSNEVRIAVYQMRRAMRYDASRFHQSNH